jgi:hypothetical protein
LKKREGDEHGPKNLPKGFKQDGPLLLGSHSGSATWEEAQNKLKIHYSL